MGRPRRFRRRHARATVVGVRRCRETTAGARGCVAAIVIATAVLAAVLASPAPANTKSVRDAKRESGPLRKHGRLDIVKATAGHDRAGRLVHSVVVRKRVDPDRGRERPVIAINTRGGRRSDPEYQVFGDAVFKRPKKGDPRRIGEADLGSRGRRWTYRLDPAVIGGLGRYGWAAITTKGNAFDIAPARRYARHRA